jgi:Flp pilus assembly protein TadG
MDGYGRLLKVLPAGFRVRCSQLRQNRLLLSEQGSELVEVALALLIMLPLVFGIAYFSLSVCTSQMAAYLAQQSARYAAARGADQNTPCSATVIYNCVAAASDVQNFAYSLLGGPVSKANTTVTAAWPGITPDCTSACTDCSTPNAQGCYVKVVVSYNFTLSLPFLTQLTPVLSSTSYQVIQ